MHSCISTSGHYCVVSSRSWTVVNESNRTYQGRRRLLKSGTAMERRSRFFLSVEGMSGVVVVVGGGTRGG